MPMRKSKPQMPRPYQRRELDREREAAGFHRVLHVEPPFLDSTLERPVLDPITSHSYRPLGWLWKDKIPMHKLTLIEGPPAVGKLFSALDIAARATRGELDVEQEMKRTYQVHSEWKQRRDAAVIARHKAEQAAKEAEKKASQEWREAGKCGVRNSECGIGNANPDSGTPAEAPKPDVSTSHSELPKCGVRNSECGIGNTNPDPGTPAGSPKPDVPVSHSEFRTPNSALPPKSERSVLYVRPDDYVPPAEKPVVIIGDEWEIGDTILPRLASLGADLDKIGSFTQIFTTDTNCGSLDHRKTNFPFDAGMFAWVMREHPRCRLIVIDNLENYCESPNQLREAIKELDLAAMRHHVTILATLQDNVRVTKEGVIRDLARKTDGQARSIWCVTPDPSHPGLLRFEPRRMAFCRKPEGLAFRINEPGKIAWEPLPPYEKPPTEAARRKQLKHTRMITWLTAVLGTGVVPAQEIYDAGAEQGFTKAKLIEARDEIRGGRTFKEGFGKKGVWLWTVKGTHEVSETEIREALSRALQEEGDAIRRAVASRSGEGAERREMSDERTRARNREKFRALNEKRPKKHRSGPPLRNGNGHGNGADHSPEYDPEEIRLLAEQIIREFLPESKQGGENPPANGNGVVW